MPCHLPRISQAKFSYFAVQEICTFSKFTTSSIELKMILLRASFVRWEE